MKNPNEYSPTVGPAKSGDTTQPGKAAPKRDQKDAKPLHAAKGNDEVMSQPPSKQT